MKAVFTWLLLRRRPGGSITRGWHGQWLILLLLAGQASAQSQNPSLATADFQNLVYVPSPSPIPNTTITQAPAISFFSGNFAKVCTTNPPNNGALYLVQSAFGQPVQTTLNPGVFLTDPADLEPPMISCPAPETVECFGQIPAPNTNAVTASDNCCPPAVLHLGDSAVTNGCVITVTRTYKATDASGNTNICTQTFTLMDTIPPVITCPANVTVQCFGSIPPPDTNAVTATDNCGVVTKSHVGDVFATNGCIITVTRTYWATDACTNLATCQQTITVQDTTIPTITCPTNVTVQCLVDLPAVNLDAVTASDNCGVVTESHVGDAFATNGCIITVTRTYRAADACTNLATCQQTITVQDTTPPVITCPTNVTVQCLADLPAVNLDAVTASDNCGVVTKSHVGDTYVTNGCIITVTRTYKATDACGNMATCPQTITVNDTTPPVITCPTNVTVQCFGNIPLPDTNTVTATDNCGTPTKSHVGDAFSTNGCVITVTRTYKATDACGNMATCPQTITVNDTVLPVITCPTNVTVQCFGNIPPPDTSLVTATDNCGTPTKSHVGDAFSTNGCIITVTRTYKATDACGNMATCPQTITVHDTIAPVLVGVPTNQSYQCLGSVPVPATVTAIDNCDTNVLITVTSTTNGTCPTIIIRTWTATDDCSNSVSARQTNTVNDTTSPVFTTCPDDQNLGCNPTSIPPCNATNAVATDNCGTPIVTCASVNGPVVGCAHYRTNVYTATDFCNNTATCRQVLSWTEDTTPPTFTSCPTNANLGCNPASIPPCNATNAVATDNCGTPNVTCASMDGPVVGCMHYRTNVYTATDACNNTATCRQVLSWTVDTTPPVITCPTNVNLGCNPASIPACNATNAVATDNCGAPTVSCASFDGPVVGCVHYRTNVYTASDACNNTATCRQVLSWREDTAPPTFTSCPTNMNLGCNPASIPACNATNAVATDNCGTPNVTCASVDGPVVGCMHYRTNVYTATDACNNTTTCRQVLSWTVDTTPPTFTTCPANLNLGCNPASIPACNATNAVATDNCGTPIVTCASVDGPVVGCVHYRTNVYTATDACNNTATCRQVLSWTVDTTPSTFTTCPANVNLGCNPASIPACNATNAVATDNCGTPIVTCASVDGPVVGCVHYRTNVYTATDACNNTATCRQVLSWTVDTTPPSFTTCPTNVNLGCNPASIPACNATNAVATDNCGTPIVTCASVDGPVVGCVHYRTNVYTATDACNNTATCRQVLSWTEDTTPPAIVCPTNMTVLCTGTNGAVVVFSATATDNCDPSVVPTCNPLSGSVFHEGTNVVTCVAVDDCGNTNMCTFTIRVDDPAGPATLSIARQGANVMICWLVSCASYELQQTPVLPAVMWTSAGGTSAIIGGQYCVTLLITSSNQFFRLKKL